MTTTRILCAAVSALVISAGMAAPAHARKSFDLNLDYTNDGKILPIPMVAGRAARRTAALDPRSVSSDRRPVRHRQPYRPVPSRTADLSVATARPSVFVPGALNCAKNVNAWLASIGHRGTGSGFAASFRHWGRESGPVPGAIAVYRCCGPTGHVAIVAGRTQRGDVLVWNPSRRGWRLGVIRHAAMSYRLPA